ncbi:MAG: TSUP family transporter [Gammaproteobacteria bacterium]
MDFAYTISGFVVGFIVGLTGIGSGSLMTPSRYFYIGINPEIAVGTDVLYAAITKCGGICIIGRERVVGAVAGYSQPPKDTECLLRRLRV